MKIIIKAADIKVATGHRQHITGVGTHSDKRAKRTRTRSAQQRAALKYQVA